MQNPLSIRCTLIIKEKLKSIDPDLYQHFKKIGLNCGVFLQRWLKCMFDREFELKEIFIIWDAIFATPDAQNGYGLVFLDYIAISMILRIRKKLLDSDQNECFTTLFKYPTIENISELVIFTNNLQTAVEEMISGKRSVFLDRLLGNAPVTMNTKNSFSPNNNSTAQNTFSGNMSFFPENYNNNFIQNKETTKENKGFFKNAFSSVGGFFSNMKQKIEKKIDQKFGQHNVNNNNNSNNLNMLGEINPIGNVGYMTNMNQINSLNDCSQRISNLFNKYSSYFSTEDANEYKAIIQYLNNYK